MLLKYLNAFAVFS